MGITSPLHLAFIAVVALLVLGPKRLPQLARTLGNGMREFREALNAASEHDEPDEPGLPSAPTSADTPHETQPPSPPASSIPPAAGPQAQG